MAKIAGIRIEDHSEEAIAEMKEKVEAWLLAVGEDAADTAASVCPVGTPESTGVPGYRGGTLRNSITAATKTKQSPANKHGGKNAEPSDYATHATPEEGEVYIGTNVEYAPYQEFGTSKIPAKHFIQFGVSAHYNEYKQMLEQALKE